MLIGAAALLSVSIMTALGDWPAVPVLGGADLVLEPLSVEHAEEMVAVLADPGLHNHIGGEPDDLEQLQERYRHQAIGHSADGSQLWFNWIVRRKDTGRIVGYVQATVSIEDGAAVAEVAWVIGSPYQGRGYARQASTAMVEWLRETGVRRIIAHVSPDHAASVAVAAGIGMSPTATVVDGEVRWST
jgi:RimJ/RimL family protein N-acetyltransferase